MFDVSTFLMRWLFLSNLVRDVAEVQTLPYQPYQPLSTFDNQNQQGDWVLRIDDNYNYDGGRLNSWSLEICTASSDTEPQDSDTESQPPNHEEQNSDEVGYEWYQIGQHSK